MDIQLFDGILTTGKLRVITASARTGSILSDEVLGNLVLQVTRDELAKAFVPGEAPAITIDAVSVGTSSTPASLSDTALGNEIGRKGGVNIEVTRASNVVTARVFFSASEANGRIREYGLWAGAKLLARLIDDRTKDNTMTMTLEWSQTIGA